MSNNIIIYDILDSVHTVIAGVTGSGKSVLLNDIIYTIIKNYCADDCKLILCDPKKTEFAKYKKLPHVLRYGNDASSILSALRKAHDLMEQRNRTAENDPWNEPDFIPVYIIIDELADFFLNCGKEGKSLLQSIAQMGRSANIHLIVATQHPSKQQFPAFIQNNFTTRVALHCNDVIQSRQILGTGGAETLTVGNAIVKVDGKSAYRVHVPFIGISEIRSVVESVQAEQQERLQQIADTYKRSASPALPEAETGKKNKPKSPLTAVLEWVVLLPVLVLWKMWENA